MPSGIYEPKIIFNELHDLYFTWQMTLPDITTERWWLPGDRYLISLPNGTNVTNVTDRHLSAAHDNKQASFFVCDILNAPLSDKWKCVFVWMEFGCNVLSADFWNQRFHLQVKNQIFKPLYEVLSKNWNASCWARRDWNVTIQGIFQPANWLPHNWPRSDDAVCPKILGGLKI